MLYFILFKAILRKVSFCSFIGFASLMGIALYAFELDEINPMKLRKVYFLPQTNFYQENRTPLVFTNRKERSKDFVKSMNNKKNSPSSSGKYSKSSEDFHKEKCKIKDFHFMREIAYTYKPETLLRWESCDALEIEIKKYRLDGKEDLISLLVKDRIDRWKHTLAEELEEVLVKPIPKWIPKMIPPSIQREAEDYYHNLIYHIKDGIFIGTVIGSEDTPHTENSSYWFNRQIYEFNEYVYGEKLSIEEKKIKINENTEMIKKLNMSYIYIMMLSSSLPMFPSKTQDQENEMALNSIQIASSHLKSRLEKWEKEKKSVQNTVSCLEKWSDWQKENLRMSYYYQFFFEYGKEIRFSEELKKNPEYWELAKSIEKKILTSDIFLLRLQTVERDTCNVVHKSPQEIMKSF